MEEEDRRIDVDGGSPGVGDKFKKVATLGGPIKVNKKNSWMYFGNGSNMSREKLFGMKGELHPGMPSSHKEAIAIEATTSDTKLTLIRELCEQSGLTRREAETLVAEMIASGKLVEVEHGDLGKVLIWRL